MSAECKDLIRRIFQPDPTTRITIAGIQVGSPLPFLYTCCQPTLNCPASAAVAGDTRHTQASQLEPCARQQST